MGYQMDRATNRLADDIASTSSDRPMKLEQYNSNKRAIRTHLCAKHDAHAILVKPGAFSPEVSLRAARLRMSELSADPEAGCRLIRGYRLVSLGDTVSYSAVGDVVIGFANGTFESLTHAPDGSQRPSVFVPSTRMHQELSDTELLSGYWLTCSVLGGSAQVVATLLRLRNNMCNFETRRLCASPEDAKARRSLAVRQFPGFAAWSKSKSMLPQSLFVDSVLSFGMPFRELRDDEMEAVYDGCYSKQQAELGKWSEYVAPQHPWEFEQRMWLPSVHRLHCLIDENQEADDELFYELYDTLEGEYAARLTNAEDRCKQEHALYGQQEFR